ncbi:unnamed protein product, partial [Meganyctiphanes norvegica]
SKTHSKVLTSLLHRNKSTKIQEDDDGLDLTAPVKFSASRAATWKVRDTYGSSKTDDLTKGVWYEPYIVSLSVTVFLIYFALLREENDVDDKLTVSLYNHIDGLEEKQLEISLKHNIEAGLDTRAIITRLAEIQLERELKTLPNEVSVDQPL